MTAPKATKLGPGTLTIGAATGAQDISCKLSAAKVEWDKDKEDDLPVLCGSTIAGSTSYTAKLSGTIAQDLDDPASIVQWSWDHKGEQHPFLFVPNTAAGKSVTGELIVDPLTVGGDEVKKNMMSDFEYDIVGEPVLGPAAAAAPAATGNAGTPGTWDPAGSTPPATVADLIAGIPAVVAAAPTTPWTAGQYVETADGADAYWSGTAWTAGQAV
jgi:hypothetical protein